MPKAKVTLIEFVYQNLEIGFFVKFTVPYTQKNWNWVVGHPNTAMVKKVRRTV